jgi:hypothetical protein
MQKNAGASPSGKPIATPSRNVPGVSRSFLVLWWPTHNVGAVVDGPYSQGPGSRLRPDRARDDLPTERKRHGGHLNPGGVFWRHREIALDQMGTNDHAFRADKRNAQAAQDRARNEYAEKEEKERAGRTRGRLARHAHVLVNEADSRLSDTVPGP